MTDFCINIRWPLPDVATLNPLYLPLLQESGADWIRVNVSCGAASHAPAYIQWIKANTNLKVLAIFDWRIFPNMDGATYFTNLAAWRTAVQTAMGIYGNLIDAIECFNELDLESEGANAGWLKNSGGYLMAERYVQMLQVLWEEAPDKIIVAGACAGLFATLPDPVIALNPHMGGGGWFLKEIQRLGADSYSHVYSFHAYEYYIVKALGVLDAGLFYQRALTFLAASSHPVWMSEMGHDGTPNEALAYMNTCMQQLKDQDCPFICWWDWIGSTTWSLINPDCSVNPTYIAFQRFTQGLAPTFPCPYCDLIFNSEAELADHITAAHFPVVPPQTYLCPYCDLVFNSEAELGAHITAVHMPVPPPDGHCFIATASGTNSPSLAVLRRFRDRRMPLVMVKTYYLLSPVLASAISNHNLVKTIPRKVFEWLARQLKNV